MSIVQSCIGVWLLVEEKEMLQHRLVSLSANGKEKEAQAKEMLQHAARQEADAQV